MEENSDKKVTEDDKGNDASIATKLNTLKPAGPIENIALLSKSSTDSDEVVERVISAEKIETVFGTRLLEEIKKVPTKEEPTAKESEDKKLEPEVENISKENTVEQATTVPLRQVPKPLLSTNIEKRRAGSATSGFVSERINRNQSDIFSLKDETTIESSIFSVNGSPSRKVYRKVTQVASSNVFPFGQVAAPPSEQATPRDKMRDKDSYHVVKRPSSSLRNPLTGTGLNSNDEYKSKGNKRTVVMEENSDKKVTEDDKGNDASIATKLNTLKPAGPIENIALLSKSSTDSDEVVERVISAEKIETVFGTRLLEEIKKVPTKEEPTAKESEDKKLEPEVENISKENTVEQATTVPLRQVPKPLLSTNIEKRRAGSATSGFVSERINRNQSDIFSLKDETTIESSIFSVNGSPSRKVYRKVTQVASSNVFPFGQVAAPPSEQATPRDKMRDKDSYHVVKRPSSSLRNPLTGTGLNSNDEYKSKGNKRTDGNPLLGLGYTPEATPSTHRIPPGGYSHKLW